jgi:hypothetical protein
MLQTLGKLTPVEIPPISASNPPNVAPEEMERLITKALEGVPGLHQDVIWRFVMTPDFRWANTDNVARFHAALRSLVARGVLKSDHGFFGLAKD